MVQTRTQYLIFGMGNTRRKMLYVEGGQLVDALTFEPIRIYEPVNEIIDASRYKVEIEERGGAVTAIFEDEAGVWIEEDGSTECLTAGKRVHLPDFQGNAYAPWLRALHAELLVNVMPTGPVPNLWVYPRPWYRDAAMMLMCLKITGNLSIVEDWAMGLHKVWDRNNSGEAEADNLGQVLFIASLFDARNQAIVEAVLKAIPNYRKNNHIIGRTDYTEHPVYQTKWLKYGLASLALDDPYQIPEVFDSYSTLFWMDYRNEHVPGERFSEEASAAYPYLQWAEAHFHNDPLPETLNELRPPLTREGAGSEADYWRLKPLIKVGAIPSDQASARMCMPHTWHAAEMFLYLIEQSQA